MSLVNIHSERPDDLRSAMADVPVVVHWPTSTDDLMDVMNKVLRAFHVMHNIVHTVVYDSSYERIVDVAYDAVSASIDDHLREVDELTVKMENMLDLKTGPRGEKGAKGDPGRVGEKGLPGEKGEAGMNADDKKVLMEYLNRIKDLEFSIQELMEAYDE